MILNIRSVCVCGGGGGGHIYTQDNNIEKTNNVQVRSRSCPFLTDTLQYAYSFKIYISKPHTD